MDSRRAWAVDLVASGGMIPGLPVYVAGLGHVHDLKRRGSFGFAPAIILLDLVTKVLSCRVGMVTFRARGESVKRDGIIEENGRVEQCNRP